MKKTMLILCLTFISRMVFALSPVDNVLSIEKSNIVVKVSDVDVLVYGVPTTALHKLLETPSQLEKNIISMLNIKTVNQYLKDEKLLQQEPFKSIKIERQFDDERISLFVKRFGYDESVFKKHLEDFEYQKQYFKTLADYFRGQISNQDLEDLAFEHYLVNKSKYLQPERRELMVVQLDKASHSKSQANDVLNQLKQDLSESFFEKTAAEHSADEASKLTGGRFGAVAKNQVNLPFAEEIFLQPVPGLIDYLYQTDEAFYIVRIVDILPPSARPFKELKEELMAALAEGMAEQKINNVINGQSGRVVANPDTARAIFSRYHFLLR